MSRLLTIRPISISPALIRSVAILIAVICLALTAVHPLMFGSLMDTDDGEMHLFRLVVLDASIRHGDLWPRYSPEFAFGYGMPVFNYYSPLSLYPLEVLHLLGLSFLDALLLSLILYAILGAMGAYSLGSAWGGPVSGAITAAAYTYAPYLLHNWYHRGAVAETLALALFPWTMWAFRRLAMRGQRGDLVLATGFLTALILTHNITALWGMAILGIYSVLLWWISPDAPRALIRLALALLFPLALAAIYWMPAIFEAGYVHLERIGFDTGLSDILDNFQTPGEIFALPRTVDLTQLAPPPLRTVAWPQFILGLIGVSLALRSRGRSDPDRINSRHWALFAGPLFVLQIFMMTRSSVWVWKAIPPLNFFQFPWRLLGPASLLLAGLAGAGVALIARKIRPVAGQGLWIGLTLLAIILYGVPWLYNVYLPDPPANSIVDAQNFERETNLIGGTASGEYLPIWTTTMPDPNRLMGLYARSDIIPRLQPAPGVTVLQASWEPHGAGIVYRASEATTLVFDWLYFPGWWAQLDHQPVEIVPTQSHGFISVGVPAGEHRLELGFGPTPLRLAATIISIAALVAMIITLGFARIWRRSENKSDNRPCQQVQATFIAVVVVGLLAFGCKALIIDNIESPFRRTRFAHGIEAGLQVPVLANFDNRFTLLGYDLPRAEVRSGQSVPLILYWTLAGGMVTEDISVVVLIRDVDENVIAQALDFYPAGVPTSTWVPGYYVREPFDLDIPPGTPPGSYTIYAGLYSESAGRNLDVLNAEGSPTGVLAELATVEVTRPLRPPHPVSLDVDELFNIPLTEALTLVSISAPPVSAEVGQQLPIVWYWRATASPGLDYHARLLWITAGGQVAAQTPVVPLVIGYPTTQWARRDLWRGLHMLYVPGRLEAGNYEVAVQLADPAGQPVGDLTVIGEMAVSTPPRTLTMPEMSISADVGWENGIRLAGYDLSDQTLRQNDGIALTLYWQPQAELSTSLTTFVHLVDTDGHIAAQGDHIPVSGTRPTTGWLPGEVVSDACVLFVGPTVPPGEYRLLIGWYDAATGERVRLTDGGDFWVLPQVITVSAVP